MHLAYPATLQFTGIPLKYLEANNSNTNITGLKTGRRKPVGYLQAWPRISTWDNREEIQKWPEQDMNPGPLNCERDALTTQPHCFLILLSLSLSLLFVILRFSLHEIPFALPSHAGHTSNLYSHVHVSTAIMVLLKDV